jgi:hypothetical protein
VGILGQSRNCLACHADNGPWRDDSRLIIDILDQAGGNSLKQKDGTFLISTKRGEAKTVLTVIGRAQGNDAPAPYRTGWLYVDPQRITEIGSLTKFARGWSVNLPMACRLVGDASKTYTGAQVTVLPMTVRPGDDAQDAEIELQFMLTKGESVKGKPKEGMLGNYFVRKVRLTVVNAKEPGRVRSEFENFLVLTHSHVVGQADLCGVRSAPVSPVSGLSRSCVHLWASDCRSMAVSGNDPAWAAPLPSQRVRKMQNIIGQRTPQRDAPRFR